MSAEAPSGRVIDGRFTLVRRLGSGGMGMVWQAYDMALHRDVALKEVRPPDPALAEYDPEGARTLRARVLREARALARLDHPNVVTIHHIVDPGEDGYPWIVMELVAGASLHDRLAEGPMEPADAAKLGRGILAALCAAHEAGIQHRDVKPANVLVRPDLRPVLTDFGIAAIRESTSLTMTGALVGSPDYIAPERIRGVEGDPASDLWSLGMMLYVAVEGRHPLRRASTLATLAAVLDEEVEPPVRAGALAPVLRALLTRDVGARPDAPALDRMLAEAEVPSAGPTPTVVLGTRPEPATPSAPGGPSAPGPAAPDPRIAPPRDRVPTGPPPSPGPFAPPAPYAAGRPDRRPRGVRAWTAVGVVGVVLAAGGAVTLVADPFSWKSGGSGAASGPSGARTGSTGSVTPSPSGPGAAGATPAGDASAEDEGPDDLLTPQGVRAVIAALRPRMGGTEVTDFTLYGEYASAEAPLPANAKLYDSWDYRDGRVTPGIMKGTIASGETAVDLLSIDWDALPALLRTAEKTLNIPEPESRYLIVDPSSPFQDDKPVLRVYVSDAYGGAHLTAGLDGTVIEKSPRETG
ncbi:serine/threonine-protein kinase [uncultured Streptomyces sp.]|uniref:serine/threonine-protein kinase n=1 Tax=uncultured Streptomyces sp. TaxID=174707 RepID=UPI00262EC06F|nr:serine/threonine protein kinase [uncultured Streptomyces sp.]